SPAGPRQRELLRGPLVPGLVVLLLGVGLRADSNRPPVLPGGAGRAGRARRQRGRPDRRAPPGSAGTLANHHAVLRLRTGDRPPGQVSVVTKDPTEESRAVRPA